MSEGPLLEVTLYTCSIRSTKYMYILGTCINTTIWILLAYGKDTCTSVVKQLRVS